jgi:predicted RNA-binding protein with PIN domain
MPYLVDGHNLIPKIGLRLEAPDDELQLLRLLQEFARLSRQHLEVYFDGAPPGKGLEKRFGLVIAHFVPSRTTADAAILARLRKLGRAARNWTVVTSDREVRHGARQARAGVESSEGFAARVKQMLRAGRSQRSGKPDPQEPNLSEDEIAQWLRLFRGTGD